MKAHPFVTQNHESLVPTPVFWQSGTTGSSSKPFSNDSYLKMRTAEISICLSSFAIAIGGRFRL